MNYNEENEPQEPSIYTGFAINVKLPDIPKLSPQGKQIIIKGEPQWEAFNVVTFPDWKHIILINNSELKILGKDLEKDMMLITKEGKFLIKDIDKNYLYHGLMNQNFYIGEKALEKIPRYKFTRKYFEDGHIEWEVHSEEEK